ncbi:MAG: hypothetical protein AB7G13_11175 [Lautropia sp.]
MSTTAANTPIDSTSPLSAPARDRLYAELAQAITTAGEHREALLLARLALLLFERLGDEAAARIAIAEALQDLPEPSLSAI